MMAMEDNTGPNPNTGISDMELVNTWIPVSNTEMLVTLQDLVVSIAIECYIYFVPATLCFEPTTFMLAAKLPTTKLY